MRGKLLTSSRSLNNVHVMGLGPMKKIKLYFLTIFDNPLKKYLIHKEILTWIGCFEVFTKVK